jgi:hypothetical protein
MKFTPIFSSQSGRAALRSHNSVLTCEKLKEKTGHGMSHWKNGLAHCVKTMDLQFSPLSAKIKGLIFNTIFRCNLNPRELRTMTFDFHPGAETEFFEAIAYYESCGRVAYARIAFITEPCRSLMGCGDIRKLYDNLLFIIFKTGTD